MRNTAKLTGSKEQSQTQAQAQQVQPPQSETGTIKGAIYKEAGYSSKPKNDEESQIQKNIKLNKENQKLRDELSKLKSKMKQVELESAERLERSGQQLKQMEKLKNLEIERIKKDNRVLTQQLADIQSTFGNDERTMQHSALAQSRHSQRPEEGKGSTTPTPQSQKRGPQTDHTPLSQSALLSGSSQSAQKHAKSQAKSDECEIGPSDPRSQAMVKQIQGQIERQI